MISITKLQSVPEYGQMISVFCVFWLSVIKLRTDVTVHEGYLSGEIIYSERYLKWRRTISVSQKNPCKLMLFVKFAKVDFSWYSDWVIGPNQSGIIDGLRIISLITLFVGSLDFQTFLIKTIEWLNLIAITHNKILESGCCYQVVTNYRSHMISLFIHRGNPFQSLQWCEPCVLDHLF